MDKATLRIVTMPPAIDAYPPGHECGYTCGCAGNQAAVAERVKFGVRATPKPVTIRQAA